MKLTLKRYIDLAAGRTYFKSPERRIYCQDTDGTWYFCSKDGEPQEEITVEILNSTPPYLDVNITFHN